MTEPMLDHSQFVVGADQLMRPCDPAQFDFESTSELIADGGLTGQPRATTAIALGLSVPATGYNLYVAGPVGAGKTTFTLHEVQERAASQPVPSDWCYVVNVADQYRPQAIELPAGQGARLATAIHDLLTACKREIPRAFEGDHYEQRRMTLQQALDEERRRLMAALEAEARTRQFTIESTPAGLFTVPVIEGRPLQRDEFERLPADQRAVIETAGEELRAKIQHFLVENRRLEKKVFEQRQTLDQEIASFVITPLVDDVRELFPDQPRVLLHLDQLLKDLVEQVRLFQPSDSRSSPELAAFGLSEDDLLARYAVNVAVDNSGLTGAPVVVEHNPTYYNLVGRIDYTARLGGMITDHRHIKVGALQRASGGYLVLQARDVLSAPMAWEALKRALRAQQIAPENLGEQFSAVPTASLKPEPIPINVKVILIGDRLIYQLLFSLDTDFQKLFKVRADFDSVMPRTPETEAAYAVFVASQAAQTTLLPFDRGGIARLVEAGSRLAGDQDKLCACFGDILNLAIESSYLATGDQRGLVTANDVERAMEDRRQRANLVEERVQEMIADGMLLIETAGAVVGQINGLSVLETGDYAFGHPSRITARVAPGTDGVVNIEREIKQSGPSHSKGILTLTGYMLGTYAAEGPLALAASLGFEQVYGGVDGDSASAAELLALLSALAEVPLAQALAITGSVNQLGQIQPIGGVNEKIEGFFAVCQQRGLTGAEGVIIPRTNLRNLMVHARIVEAVRAGQFRILAVETIDQALEILTSRAAGHRASDGHYPTDSIHGLVAQRLTRFAQQLSRQQTMTNLNGWRRSESEEESPSDRVVPA